jgi:hypothetical protein
LILDGCGLSFLTPTGGSSTANLSQLPLSAQQMYAGGTISNCAFGACTSSGNINLTTFTLSSNITFTNTYIGSFSALTQSYARTSGSASNCIFLDRCKNLQFNGLTLVGGRMESSYSENTTVSNLQFADRQYSVTTSANPISMISMTNTTDFVVDNPSFLVSTGVHPYNSVILIANSKDVTIRNVGSMSAPLYMNAPGGGVHGSEYLCSVSTTNTLSMLRCYVRDARLGIVTPVVTVRNVTMQNVVGDANDAVEHRFTNCTPKGVGWTPGVTIAASIVGHHWLDAFVNDNQGRIMMTGNETSSETESTDQVVLATDGVGSTAANFTGGGAIRALMVDDTVVWTTPYYILGYRRLCESGLGALLTPTYTEANGGNFFKYYQIDLHDGLGFRSSNGVGAYEFLTAQQLHQWAIDPILGFKLKIKYKVMGQATNTISFVRLDGVTTRADYISSSSQYALPSVPGALSITGLVSGSRVQIYNVTAAAELMNAVVNATSYTANYTTGYNTNDAVRIRVVYVSGASAMLPFTTTVVVGSAGWSAVVSQVADSVYNTNALSGSAYVSQLTANTTTNQIEINAVANTMLWPAFYAWYQYTLMTNATALQNWWTSIQAVSVGIYEIIAPLKLNNQNVITCTMTGGTLYASDNQTWVATSPASVGAFKSLGAVFKAAHVTGLPFSTQSYDNLRTIYYL